MHETWLPILEFFGVYEVSDFGRVRRSGRVLKERIDKSNRPRVSICLNSKAKDFLIHYLVASTFIGQRPDGFDCCHNDGNPMNNRVDNLRWDSKAANQADRYKHGTMCIGSKNPMAKLSDEKVKAILADCRPQSSIALDYGIAQQTVSKLKSGIRWGHIKRGVVFSDSREAA